jgi:uncharacterized membrane protein (Fun14 family)
MPFVSTVGFGGIVGFLIGFTIKRIMKILAVIAGVFFAALLYLEPIPKLSYGIQLCSRPDVLVQDNSLLSFHI